MWIVRVHLTPHIAYRYYALICKQYRSNAYALMAYSRTLNHMKRERQNIACIGYIGI